MITMQHDARLNLYYLMFSYILIVYNMLCVFQQYDATLSGGHGSGGEYEVQMGFGWTNGIIMEFLQKYGSRATAEDRFVEASKIVAGGASSNTVSSSTQFLTAVLAILATISAGCIG